jgi:hypothetical protein
MGILVSSSPLLSSQSINPARQDLRQRGQTRPRSETRSESKESIRVSRPDLSQPARSDPRRNPSPKGRSESACLIRVMIRVVSPPPLFLPYVPAMTAIGRRSTNSRGSEATEPSPGAGGGAGAGGALQHPPVGHCAAWVQLQRSAARSARLSTCAAGPGDLLQRRCLRGGSSRFKCSGIDK